MNIVDVIIVLFLISALFRGREVGFVRQLFSTVGFFGGLLIGTLLEPHLVQSVHTAAVRSMLTLLITLGSAFLFLTIGEYIGIVLKTKVQLKQINVLDNILGSGLAFMTVLLGIWLSAAIIQSLPPTSFQMAVKNSAIVGLLNRRLPPSPPIIAGLSHLIDPNGFPQVFIGGNEPSPDNLPLPDLGQFQTAVEADRPSIVKIEGQGCGGIVEGTGFVAASGLLITNAHVVAGIKAPYVLDSNGTHTARVMIFDPDLDIAVLRVDSLAGKPLIIEPDEVGRGTAGIVAGYPGGGNFTAKAAAVLDKISATGRNIYDRGNVVRDIYEVKADIIPGNSGGPLIGKDGAVIGVVFAQSTTYNHVGYALTTGKVIDRLQQAQRQTHSVSTGSCAE